MDENFIPVAYPYVAKNQFKYVEDCLKTNWVSSLGRYIPNFEEEFSKYIGCRHGVATSNGTTALHLALEALGIGEGDEVIVPDLTFVATANAVAYTGAKPVFADVSDSNWCINPQQIEQKITKKTKAIIPVHLYGNVCDMNAIAKIAKLNDLFVIEDVAEAIGAEYGKKKAGSFGDISCFSFYGNKIITTGEGGMCLTDNHELRSKMELLKDHGMSKEKRYFHIVRGFNYRMTNIQAAIGLAQLEDIKHIMKQRDKISQRYSQALKEISGIRLSRSSELSRSVCWLYSLIIDDSFFFRRDEVIQKLSKRGIDSRPFFYSMHKLPIYSSNATSCPVSWHLSERGINLPTSTSLSEEDIDRVCNALISMAR